MIDFDYLEGNLEDFQSKFKDAQPFEHLVIDAFCDGNALRESIQNIPNPESAGVNKSRDFVFAKNKFEKSDFNLVSPGLAELKEELLSVRFSSWISAVTGQKIFVDPEFHGGGLHQGGSGSFLNMHADFNYHPLHKNWFRNVNMLLYLNEDWEDSFGGELKLVDGRVKDGSVFKVPPVFNRAVLMLTRNYTLHGYDSINFPEGSYRRSIAIYGYTEVEEPEALRTTVWYPEDGGFMKKVLGRHMPKLVRLKTKIIGSGTEKNK